MIDDHALYREGLRAVLARDRKLDVVAEAATAIEALARAIEGGYEQAIVDVTLPDCPGASLDLLRDPAAVDGDRLAGDERGCVRRQPQHGLRDLLGPTQSTDRLAGDELALDLRLAVREAVDHRSLDHPRAHGVDADVGSRELECRGARQADDPVLAGNVCGNPGEPDQAGDRRAVDDRAAALLLHLCDLVLHAQPHAFEVDRDDAVPVVLRAICGRRLLAFDACVVERAIDAAEGFDRAADRRTHVALLRHVAVDE